MNRFLALLFVALITFLAVLYVKRPDILNDIWIWVLGLVTPIFALIKRVYQEIAERFKKEKQASTTQPPVI